MCKICGSRDPLTLSFCMSCYCHESDSILSLPKEEKIFNKEAILQAVELEDVVLISLLLQTTKRVTKKKNGWWVSNPSTGKGKLFQNLESIGGTL